MAPSTGPIPGHSEATRGIRLLSLDGGPNGIPLLKTLKSISAHLLEEENRLRSIRGEPDELVPRKPCEYFDMIAGSGSGGIVALLIGSLGMGLDEAIDRYRLLLDQVNTTSDNGDPETSQEARSSALEKELREIVASIAGDPDSLLLKDGAELSSCKTFVCTRNEHNMNANTPVILRSYASVHSVHESCNIWEAGRATSATPGIYNSTRIGNLGPFVGGAWGCSNPTHVLLEEAAKEFPGRKLASLISIGTGHPRTISLSKSTLTEVAMQIAKDCENVHERMLRFFANQKNVYHRLNVEQGLQMTDRDLLTDSAEVEAHTDAYLASAAVQLALPELAKLFAQAVGKVDPNLLLSAPPPSHKGNRLLIRPPPPSRVFTGRKDMIEAIEASLLPKSHVERPPGQQRFVLYSLGGSGKTQIALEFIQLHASRFTRKYLINSSSEQSVNSALESIGLELGIPEPTASDTLDCLCRLEEEWLLLYDNADNPSLNLHKFFPPCSHGNILITSRNEQSYNYSQPSTSVRKVHVMTPEDSVSLLTSLTSRKTLDAKDKALLPSVADMLGHIALALVQCGSYIAVSPGMTFQRYMDLFRRRRKELLNPQSKPLVDLYEFTVYATWTISYNELTNPAKSLLNVCSFFHFDGITMEIFTRAAVNAISHMELCQEGFKPGLEFLDEFVMIMIDADHNGKEVAEVVEDVFQLNEAVVELTAYSLMQDSLSRSFSIHPLVQSWCQDREDHDTHFLRAQAVLALSAGGPDGEDSSIHRLLLLPHLNAVLATLSPQRMHTAVAMQFAEALRLVGQLDTAAGLWLDIAGERAVQLGGEHPDTLMRVNRLGTIYSDQGLHEKGETILSEVLESQKHIMGLTHRETLASMNNLALTYEKQGRLQEAEVLQLEVLDIQKRTLGVAHPNTLRSMNNLGVTYSNQGRLNDAAVIQYEVLEVQKRILGPKHPATLTSMSNMAQTYSEQSRLQDAEVIQLDVLEIQKRVLGSAHLHTLKSMSNLAHTYSEQGRNKDAEVLQFEVLEARKHLLGVAHPDTLLGMSNLGITYSHQGRLNEAKMLQLEVLEAQKCILGPKHPATLRSMNNLAQTYWKQGQHKDAEILQFEALEIWKCLRGPTHPATLTAMNNLAVTYCYLGRYDEAVALMTEAVKGRRECLGAEHLHTLLSVRNLELIQDKLSGRVPLTLYLTIAIVVIAILYNIF